MWASQYSCDSVVPLISQLSVHSVTLSPASKYRRTGWSASRGTTRRLDVAAEVGLDQDAPVPHVVLQRGVLREPGAVPDPVGVAEPDGLGHRVGPGRLAGVDRDAEAAGERRVEGGAVDAGRPALLAAGQVEADHAAGRGWRTERSAIRSDTAGS